MVIYCPVIIDYKHPMERDFATYIYIIDLRDKLEFIPEINPSKLSQTAQFLNKYILTKYINEPFEILKTNGGKPHLNNNHLHFNYSHTPGVIVVGVSRHPIGVDVEILKERQRAMGIAHRYFHKNEIYQTGNSLTNFYKCWTRKEAYSKCTGEGLNSQLKEKDLLSQDVCEDKLFSSFHYSDYMISTCIQSHSDSEVIRFYTPPHQFSDFIVREIHPKDNPQVEQLIKTVMPEFGACGEGFSIADKEVQNMFAAYNQPRSKYYVVERDGQIVGASGIAPLEGANPQISELRKMYFYKEVRGLGLGKHLMDLCLKDVQRYKYQSCYLETLGNMNQARALYEKYGFEPLEERKGQTGHFGCNHFYLKTF